MITDRRAFILEHTRLQAPPHAPELQLHLADEITPIWRLTEEELGDLGLPPPFWAFAWAGGQGVARWVLDHPEKVRGRRVLDIACGGGIAGLAAMKAGAVSAIGADIDPFCDAAVGLNAEANGTAMGFLEADLLDGPPPDAEVVLAGDLFYERPLAERAFAWLRRAHEAGARVILGDPGRTYFDRSGLVQLADYRVPTTRELEDAEVKRTGVWTFE
jgi:predicted nicotinamide N-methyase